MQSCELFHYFSSLNKKQTNFFFQLGFSEIMGKSELNLEEKYEMDLSEFERVIESMFEITFGMSTLEQAKKDKDQQRCQLLLQLQDFATVVKANRAMSAGDIGRLI